MCKMRILIALIMLLICSIADIRTGYINLWVVLMSALLVVVVNVCSLKSYLLVLASGTVMILLARQNDQLGEGDVYIFIALEIILSVISAVTVFIYAFIAAGAFSLVGIIINRELKKIPFVPFILLGFIIYYAKIFL